MRIDRVRRAFWSAVEGVLSRGLVDLVCACAMWPARYICSTIGQFIFYAEHRPLAQDTSNASAVVRFRVQTLGIFLPFLYLLAEVHTLHARDYFSFYSLECARHLKPLRCYRSCRCRCTWSADAAMLGGVGGQRMMMHLLPFCNLV